MPTIEASKKDLERLIGKKLNKRELEEMLMYAKAELDEIRGDMLKIDVKDTNRPDLWSIEGIAREIKGRLNKRGLPKYKVGRSKLKIFVDKKVFRIRPYIAACIVKDIKVSEKLLVQIIQLQEKVAQTYGRKRKEAAIGIYDFGKLQAPLYYTAFKPKEKSFIPLDYKVEMTLDEILREHPKGKEYGFLLEGFERYPILMDCRGVVASMPPIINSQITGKVTEKTKIMLVEVTGYNWETVSTALNVMVTALAERGAKLESVEIVFPNNEKKITPELKPRKAKLRLEKLNELSGLNLNVK
ncbi:MAG: phenylalanine--tRNA ligase subunit beta, partial [Candidatus Diapherotrites archaeon]|nr:phenylalanine--tRNA ligase subunit beta [Candidatus Diapherotrites archaeon]